MTKKSRTFISLSILLVLICLTVGVRADQHAEFTISTNKEIVDIGEEFNITVWLEGKDHAIDGFIIREISWSPDCLEVVNISAGWWDWLWDEGDNFTSHIEQIQAGQKYKTQLKKEACFISFKATNSGECTISIDEADVISGGPLVPCTVSQITITIMGDDPPEEDPETPTNPFIPEEDPEQPLENTSDPPRDNSNVDTGSFDFHSDDIDESTVDPDQDNEDNEDEEKPIIPWFNILTFLAIGSAVLIGIVVFTVKNKQKKDQHLIPKTKQSQEHNTYGTWIDGKD
ncbi:MAG: hypothetical protein U9N86_10270 [Bacteroidota bacterium]|nr:hypothetical protein [Bacteroidota bacterium]